LAFSEDYLAGSFKDLRFKSKFQQLWIQFVFVVPNAIGSPTDGRIGNAPAATGGMRFQPAAVAPVAVKSGNIPSVYTMPVGVTMRHRTWIGMRI
jgi:hypothetical protein